jgi:hypothetical protein
MVALDELAYGEPRAMDEAGRDNSATISKMCAHARKHFSKDECWTLRIRSWTSMIARMVAAPMLMSPRRWMSHRHFPAGRVVVASRAPMTPRSSTDFPTLSGLAPTIILGGSRALWDARSPRGMPRVLTACFRALRQSRGCKNIEKKERQ